MKYVELQVNINAFNLKKGQIYKVYKTYFISTTVVLVKISSTITKQPGDYTVVPILLRDVKDATFKHKLKRLLK